MIAVIRTFHIIHAIIGAYSEHIPSHIPNSYDIVLYTVALQVVVTRRMVELFSCLLDRNDRGRALEVLNNFSSRFR